MYKMADGSDVDPEQHERVVKALEQVNGLKYRECLPMRLCCELTPVNDRKLIVALGYNASPKEAKKVLDFHSDDSDSDGESHGHARIRRASRANDNDDQDADDNVDAGLSFDDHIDRILRKTRTIALLKIANNTAEILPEDDGYGDDDEDAFDFDDGDEFNDDDDDDVDSTETEDRFNNDNDRLQTASSPSLRDQKSFRRGNSMRSTTNSVHSNTSKSSGSGGGSRRDHNESVAAMRLVRTLSSFLSLPRVISYKDLEMVRTWSSKYKSNSEPKILDF